MYYMLQPHIYLHLKNHLFTYNMIVHIHTCMPTQTRVRLSMYICHMYIYIERERERDIVHMNPIQPASASRPEATVPFHRNFLRRQSVPGLPSPARRQVI